MRAARFVFSHWLLALCVLALASLAPLAGAGAGSAMADGLHHGHAAAQAPIAQAASALAQDKPEQRAISADYPLAASSVTKCPSHESHKGSPVSKACCGSMCCAAALAWDLSVPVALGVRADSFWLFSRQFVLSDAVFGLDRPPDFPS